ncbi:TOMM precursor leader peptide-binding protein [Paenibacillus sp. OAS669]|uniref:TOMM precursor leader peptide-binding protein n=1 Tax=Paenibacillus sp. OAS669 TaxID=2663821 RepID=UPI00178A161D|nr:TOMM precursor leader peptide-binding protein [Paenibacillus sp. OAS669]MBE1446780.1 ribosomal protein S12 methylthiotransferase accessory factor [Paenibacillus sp. OAS669]
MNTGVAVIGEGQLAELVCGELSSLCRLARRSDFKEGVPEGMGLALVLSDAWHPLLHREAEEVFRSLGIPWLRGFVAFGEGAIGPLVRPGLTGCSQCADTRHLMAGRDRKEMWMLEQRLTEHGGVPHDAWASRTGLLQMAHLILKECRAVLEGGRSRLEERMLFLDMKSLRASSHFFLPDPLCPVCSQLPEDTPAGAQITLQPSPKVDRASFRSKSLKDLAGVLVQDYLDIKTGFLNGKMMDFVSPFADVSVNLPLFDHDEVTAGRTHSYASSELTAIMEGLERYCGMEPRGKRLVIRDSYRNLADSALHPAAAGLYATEQYERPHFPFKPFHPDDPIDWVWGYSFGRQSPILVPLQLAYYTSPCGQGFVYETSNGCALGGSLEEAIFYGIMEVVERDSFLLTWYARLPLPRLDPFSAGDSELELMLHRLKAVAGFDVLLYNATMENGIPSVWALAKNTKPNGLNLICAAGAHPDPVRAAKSSVHELSGMMLTLNGKFEENREQYARMLHDPSLVRGMEDHSMLYSLREAEERLHFLLAGDRPLRSFEEEFKRPPEHPDLTDDLKDVLQAFRRLQLDVIVVDQTTPELKLNDLHCVKVLIPGMLPMTFGHHLVRLTGLDRVLKVPQQLGYTKRPLLPEELNPYPHPFP